MTSSILSRLFPETLSLYSTIDIHLLTLVIDFTELLYYSFILSLKPCVYTRKEYAYIRRISPLTASLYPHEPHTYTRGLSYFFSGGGISQMLFSISRRLYVKRKSDINGVSASVIPSVFSDMLVNFFFSCKHMLILYGSRFLFPMCIQVFLVDLPIVKIPRY